MHAQLSTEGTGQVGSHHAALCRKPLIGRRPRLMTPPGSADIGHISPPSLLTVPSTGTFLVLDDDALERTDPAR